MSHQHFPRGTAQLPLPQEGFGTLKKPNAGLFCALASLRHCRGKAQPRAFEEKSRRQFDVAQQHPW